jgi:hypothetical protein
VIPQTKKISEILMETCVIFFSEKNLELLRKAAGTAAKWPTKALDTRVRETG